MFLNSDDKTRTSVEDSTGNNTTATLASENLNSAEISLCKRAIADSNAATLDSSTTIIASLSLGIYKKIQNTKRYKTYGSQQRQKNTQWGTYTNIFYTKQMGQANIQIYKRVQNKYKKPQTKTKRHKDKILSAKKSTNKKGTYRIVGCTTIERNQIIRQVLCIL